MLTPVLATVGMWTAILSALGLVLTAGRAKKGPMRFVSGLASLYDSTSYVSDLIVVFPPDGPGIDHRRHGLGFQ